MFCVRKWGQGRQQNIQNFRGAFFFKSDLLDKRQNRSNDSLPCAAEKLARAMKGHEIKQRNRSRNTSWVADLVFQKAC